MNKKPIPVNRIMPNGVPLRSSAILSFLLMTFITTLLFSTATTFSIHADADDDRGQCDHSDCLTLITDNSGDNWVYPLAWMPYIQEKITFSIDGDHDVAMSLSKHTDPIAVRYLVIFQEDNTNKASIKRCHHNSSYSCIDESHAESSSPYLVKGRQRSYWLKVNSDDNGVAIGHQGEEIPFVAFKPGFGHEVGIHWIGLSGANAGVTWQFCDLVVKEIAQQKPTFQSSTLVESGISYNATRANDFETALKLPTGHCSQTEYFDLEPWWRVDLQDDYIVKMVRLWNDVQDRPHLLEGVTIYVASDIFSTNQQLCGAGPVTLDEAEMDRHVIRICDNAPGKYVFLVKRAPDLKLCDVEVFGYREDIKSTSCMETSNTSTITIICIVCSVLLVLIGAALLTYAYIYPTSCCGLQLLKIRNSFRKDTVSTMQPSSGKYSLVKL